MFETNMELAHEIINHLKLKENAIILDCVEYGCGTSFKLKTESQLLKIEVNVKSLKESEEPVNE